MASRAARTVCREMADFLEGKYGDGEPSTMVGIRQSTVQRWLLLLSPPRKKRPRDVPRSARRATVKELDALCREVVFLRDGGKCRKCGKTTGLLDWAHVYSRRFKVTRWALGNSLVLCRACHMRWHASPPEMVEWWRKEVGPEAARRLDVLKRAAKCGPLELIKASLEQERRRLA